ncbi:SUKH-4 family immunity protein [Paenibacillus daejeonensis]|uniref:SUKH-4 family immunity protein n=1 Tax=Paenibacillus daejeonensis TaxID=135193 RepID=UPI0003602630|nr:SUKH-4 family immunity protein [Paenibacillus daejeonensis]
MRTFDHLYTEGRLDFTAESLGELGLSSELAAELSKWGLPQFAGKEPPLGMVFEAPYLRQELPSHVVIGREIWEEGLYITMDQKSGVVWAISEGEQQKPVYMNASITGLLTFMDRILGFRKQTDALPPAPPPSVWTAEQMKERLEKLRNGELRPVSNPEDEQARRQRASLFRQLKRELKTIDAQALRAACWWGTVLEEMADELQ